MKNFLVRFCFLFVLAINLIQCKKETPSNNEAPIKNKVVSKNEKLNTFKTDSYSIDFPKSATIRSVDNKVDFILSLSTKKDDNDDFVENINLVSEKLSPANKKLSEVITTSENELKTIGEITSSKPCTINGLEGHQIQFKIKNDAINVSLLQNLVIHNNTVYVLTYTASEKSYEKYFSEAEAIMKSITFK